MPLLTKIIKTKLILWWSHLQPLQQQFLQECKHENKFRATSIHLWLPNSKKHIFTTIGLKQQQSVIRVPRAEILHIILETFCIL